MADPTIPPHIEFLRSELPKAQLGLEDFARLVSDKGFARDLGAQAEFALTKYPYGSTLPDEQSSELSILAGGGFDPLDGEGICSSPPCRVKAAADFARVSALYSEQTVVPDVLAQRLVAMGRKRLNPLMIYRRYGDVAALQAIMPLIEAQVVVFADPRHFLCASCARKLEATIRQVSRDLWEKIADDLEATVRRTEEGWDLWMESDYFQTSSGGLAGIRFRLTPARGARLMKSLRMRRGGRVAKRNHEKLEEIMGAELSQIVLKAAIRARTASDNQLACVSTFRLEMAALRQLDLGPEAIQGSVGWERMRRVNIPWIGKLNAQELLQLRAEAGDALPAFRAHMRRMLYSTRSGSPSVERVREIATELREAAEELRVELRKASGKALRRSGHAIGGGALGLILYGLGGSDMAAATIGVGLLGALAALHTQDQSQREHENQLLRKPAYVLLKGRELLSLRHKGQ